MTIMVRIDDKMKHATKAATHWLDRAVWPNKSPEPTATVPAVSIMFGFIVCPFGCVSQARGRGSAFFVRHQDWFDIL